MDIENYGEINMIGNILEVITKELNAFISLKINNPGQTSFVYLASPVDNDGESFSQGDGVYLSLLNIEEELILREGAIKQRVVANQTCSSQPPVNINLQVIFIVNFSNDYIQELNVVYWVMEFFQIKPLFNAINTPQLAEVGFTGDDKLIFELNTLPLQDQHYIWGNLDLNQMPSITYQVKMLTIQNSAVLTEGGVVESIEFNKKE